MERTYTQQTDKRRYSLQKLCTKDGTRDRNVILTREYSGGGGIWWVKLAELAYLALEFIFIMKLVLQLYCDKYQCINIDKTIEGILFR